MLRTSRDLSSSTRPVHIMPHSVIASLALWLPLFTAGNSIWELSRKIRKKLAEKDLEYEARRVYRHLCEAEDNRLISGRACDNLYEIFLAAMAEKDGKNALMFRLYRPLSNET